jgi:hypothetical protein
MMKMLLETADMVRVRMGVEKPVNEQPALVVPVELLSELLGNVGRIIVPIVGGFTDIDVGQDPAA